MEKIMHKKLYHFLEENNILFKKQFGFKKNNSTVYALIEITEKVKNQLIVEFMGVVSLLTWGKLLALSIMIFYWWNFSTMASETICFHGLNHI